MWPFKSNRQNSAQFVLDMHQSIAATWNPESLYELFEDDEDAMKRFIFSSFIQALVFYAPSELNSSTGESSERSNHVIALLSLRFLKSNEDVVVGNYVVNIRDRWHLPAYLKTYFDIDSDPTNCFRLRLPLYQLIIAVLQMRIDLQLSDMAAEPAKYLGNLYDYHDPFNPRLILAGVSLKSVVFDEDIVLYNTPEIVEQEWKRSDILISHCRDLLEAVVTTIKKHA